jgi:ADP-ribosylglycohydrolase
MIDRIRQALLEGNRAADPCDATGEGWIAEESFATGLLCFLLYPDSPREMLRHAATTCGDSDSIACLAGAFAGAYHGFDFWPEQWQHRIEYRDQLDFLARRISESYCHEQ